MDCIRRINTTENACFYHFRGATGHAFLVRLEEDTNGAMNMVTKLACQKRNADTHCRVGIMSTQVSNAVIPRSVVCGFGIYNRECVYVGTIGDAAARVIAHDVNEPACLCNRPVHLQPLLCERLSDER